MSWVVMYFYVLFIVMLVVFVVYSCVYFSYPSKESGYVIEKYALSW